MEESKIPAVAAAASWMEAMKIPMREIEKKFTKSELFIMAWRSREQAASMTKRTKASTASVEGEAALGSELKETLSKYITEDGEVDLTKLTGEQAMRYFASQGLHFPLIQK